MTYLPIRARMTWLSIFCMLGFVSAQGLIYGQAAGPDADIDRDGSSCTTITLQTMLQTASGTLPLGQFRDWCFSAAAGDLLEFSTCPPEGSTRFVAGLELRDPGEQLLASDYGGTGCFSARLYWRAPADDSYRIRLRSFGGEGDTYTLGYRRLPLADCVADLPLTTSFQTISGAIASGESRDYCFNATIGRTYVFTTCSPGSATFDTVLEVFDGLGRTRLAYNDDYCDTQSFISWTATLAGPLRVRVSGFGAASGNFVLAYRQLPTARCPDLAPEPDFQEVEGSIQPGEYQEFCVDTVAGETYEFQTCGPGDAEFASALDILSEGVGGVRGTACAAQSKITWTAPFSRRMRVRVSGARPADGGRFRLAYRRVRCLPINVEADYQIASGELERGGFVDYCFSALPRQMYEFSTCTPGSAEFASVLGMEMLPSGGSVFTQTTRCGLQSRLIGTPSSGGTHRVRLRGSQTRESGSFELAYRLRPPPPPPPCTDITLENYYQYIQGGLSAGGFRDYCFDAETGDGLEVTTCPPEGGGSISTSLSIAAVAGGALETLQYTYCGSYHYRYRVTASGRFRLRVSNPSSGPGTFTLAHRSFVPPPCTEIVPGDGYQTETGALAEADRREYCFDAVANQTYEFTTCLPGRVTFFGGMYLHDSTSSQPLPVVDEASCGAGRSLFFKPPRDGRYLVRLASSTDGGSYTLAYQLLGAAWRTQAAIPIAGGIVGHAVVAADDLLYLIGGLHTTYSNQVWVYDPVEDQWSRKADLPVATGLAPFGAAAALDGRIYVFGGVTQQGQATDTTWIYDIANDTWSSGRRMPAPSAGAIVAAANDRLWIFNGPNRPATTWEYDPGRDTFTTRAAMPYMAGYTVYGSAAFPDGQPEVHVFDTSANHVVYDVLSDSWRSGPSMPFSLANAVVVSLADQLYVLGGASVLRNQIYDTVSRTWSTGPPLVGSFRSAAGDVAYGMIFLMGGYGDGGSRRTTNFSWLVE